MSFRIGFWNLLRKWWYFFVYYFTNYSTAEEKCMRITTSTAVLCATRTGLRLKFGKIYLENFSQKAIIEWYSNRSVTTFQLAAHQWLIWWLFTVITDSQSISLPLKLIKQNICSYKDHRCDERVCFVSNVSPLWNSKQEIFIILYVTEHCST